MASIARIVVNVATINEKLANMLATIKELRKGFKNEHSSNSLLTYFDGKSEVTQEELFQAMPSLSVRTLRRRINELLKNGDIVRRKEGRFVFYVKKP